MFTASVKSKELLNGTLTVIVTFTNGEQTFNEEFKTSSVMDENWLVSAVANRIKQLDSLYDVASTLKLGKIDIPDDQPVSDPDHP